MPPPGRSTLLVEILDDDGVTWVNVTARVRLEQGWTCAAGRRTELDDVDSSELSLTLDNTDGALTVGGSLGVYDDQPIRVSETVTAGGAVTFDRFYGFVQGWPLEWPDPGAWQCLVKISARDQQPRLLRDTFDPLIVEETRGVLGTMADAWTWAGTAWGLLAYYPCTEAVGAVSVGDSSGRGQPPMVAVGTGATPVLGEPFEVPGGEGGTGARLRGGQWLRISRIYDASPDGQVLSLWFTTTHTPPAGFEPTLVPFDDGNRVAMAANGKLRFYDPNTSSLFTAGPAVNDGLVHHLLVHCVNLGLETNVYLDGQLVATIDNDLLVDADLEIGGMLAGAYDGGTDRQPVSSWIGTIGHVAAWVFQFNGTLPPASHWLDYYARLSGQDPLSSSEWIERLATHAGADAPDGAPVVRGDAGILDAVPLPATGGVAPWEAMRTIQRAEGAGAVVFVGRDGHTTLHNGHHRAYTSTGAPAMVIPSDDLLSWPGVLYDREQIVNTVEVSRLGGAQTLVRDAASVDKRGPYPADMTGLPLLTDAEAIRRGEWRVNKYGQPRARLPQVRVNLMTASAEQQKAFLALEMGDMVRVTGLPPTAPAAWGGQLDLIVESVTTEQSDTDWIGVLDTSSADLFRAWILEDPVYGLLGQTTVPIY